MSQMKVDHITGEKFLHTSGKRLAASPGQYMEVVGKEALYINNEIPVQALVSRSV